MAETAYGTHPNRNSRDSGSNTTVKHRFYRDMVDQIGAQAAVGPVKRARRMEILEGIRPAAAKGDGVEREPHFADLLGCRRVRRSDVYLITGFDSGEGKR